MSRTGFSTSTGIGGGDPHADYNPTSTDLQNQPAGDSGHYGGGIGDRTEGSAGADKSMSIADQYGSSGGYMPENVEVVERRQKEKTE